MTNRRWQQVGPHVPFPRPVPYEAEDFPPIGNNLVGLCIDGEWLPYLIGAAKSLTDPATWLEEDWEDSLGKALAAEVLLAQLSDAQAGCLVSPGVFSPHTCEQEFVNDGMGSYEFLYRDPDKWGDWVLGTGAIATVAYNSDVSLYIRRLAMRWDFGADYWVYGLGFVFSTEVDLAPGGDTYRVSDLQLLDASNTIRHEQYITHGSTSLNETVYSVVFGGPVHVRKLLVNCWAGASPDAGDLDPTSFTVKDIALYCYSSPYPCT